MGKVKNCFWVLLCSELLLVLVQCCAYWTGEFFQVCWGLDNSSSWTKPLQPQRMQGNIKMPVPAGINEDTDASVEPRQGRISSFLLAPLPGK